jgi:hypothetical protein
MSTALDRVTETHARQQKRLALRTAGQLLRLWRAVDSGHIGESWRGMLIQAVGIMATAQAAAAASAGLYLDDALDAQGIPAEADGRVISTAFGLSASDGRDLPGLLFQPAIQALTTIKGGGTVARARAVGLLTLDKIVRTQVADAGRAAEAVGIATRPTVQGYVRMLSLPSCSRCVILAGRFYRWNAGFRRHPRCDCRHIPTRENVSGDIATDPKQAFRSMSGGEQNRVFGKAGADAIRDGADIAKVVNARRGMETATVNGRAIQVTREGVRRNRPVRLMPEQIVREANGNRAETVRLLRLHGYIN